MSIAIVFAAVVSGCASLSGYPSTNFPSQEDLKKSIIALTQADIDEYFKATPEQRRDQRDRFVIKRVAAIDTNFYYYTRKIYGEDVFSQVGIEWVAIGTATAGALISNSTTQAILAGITAALIGAKAAFDKVALAERSIPALMSQMHANRLTVWARILMGLNRPVDEYSLLHAQSDVQAYYMAGTIPGAITGVMEAAAVQSAKAEEQIKRIQYRLDPTRDVLRDFLCADTECEKFKEGALAKVIQCMQEERLPRDLEPPSEKFFDFIFAEEFASEREKVGACLRR